MDDLVIVTVAPLIAVVVLKGIDAWRDVHISKEYTEPDKEKYEFPTYKYTKITYKHPKDSTHDQSNKNDLCSRSD